MLISVCLLSFSLTSLNHFIEKLLSFKLLSASVHSISLCFNLLVLFLQGVLSQIDHVLQRSDIPKGGNNNILLL